MHKKQHSPIHGLRDVGQFKLYEKRTNGKVEIFVSNQVSQCKLIRVKITRECANKIASLPKSNFAESCQQLIEGAKRAGSPNYFEN
jgi:hypothetical protein